jgi:hypothetical protein
LTPKILAARGRRTPVGRDGPSAAHGRHRHQLEGRRRENRSTGWTLAGELHGGEGIKERCDFLAFAAQRGATLDDLA